MPRLWSLGTSINHLAADDRDAQQIIMSDKGKDSDGWSRYDHFQSFVIVSNDWQCDDGTIPDHL